MATAAALEFEKPIAELEQRIDDLKRLAGDASFGVALEIEPLERRLTELRREIYRQLTPLQRVEVARFKPLLQQAFDASESNDAPLRIDLAAVTECDGAGMQMMLALSRSASAASLSLELRQVPSHMAGLFERFGLTPHFTTFTKKEAK